MFAPDFESKLFLDAAAKLMPLWSPDDVAKGENFLRNRAEMVRAGLLRCPTWFQEELMKIDGHLRCWWDAWKEEWVIDRFQNESIVEGLLRMADNQPNDAKQAIRKSATGLLEKGRYYLTVLHFKPEGELQLNQNLLNMLRATDMQRYQDPAGYIAKRDADAEARRKSIDASDTQKILAAVDNLSDKQVHEFIEVSRALGTGETIVCHGEGAKFMEGIAEARRKGPPMPVSKPNVFRPKRKGYK